MERGNEGEADTGAMREDVRSRRKVIVSTVPQHGTPAAGVGKPGESLLTRDHRSPSVAGLSLKSVRTPTCPCISMRPP
jgi:hypothetical protein